MNGFLLSNHHYQVELIDYIGDAFSVIDPSPLAGQCDCDCSSDCACTGDPSMPPNHIHIEFANRKKELERIIKAKNDIVLDAPAGYGKTYLLEKAKKEMTRMGWKAIYLNLVGPNHKPINQDILAKQMLQALGALQEVTERDVTIHDLTKACTAYDKIILLFDSLENVDPNTLVWLRSDLIQGIRNTVKNTLRVIFSGRYIYNNAKTGEWNNFFSVKLNPLTPENIQEVLEKLPPKPPPDYWAGWIFWLSGGHPASIEAIINELDEFHWKLRLPMPLFDLQKRFQRRVSLYVDEVKKSVKAVLAEDMDALWIFRVLDVEIIQYLQEESLIVSTHKAGHILSDLSKARLIRAGDYFYSDAVFQRLISISTEVMEPEKFNGLHTKALEIFNRKLASLYATSTPTMPLVEAHFSEIIYHTIQTTPAEEDLTGKLVNSLLKLPDDPPRFEIFSATLEREENSDLDAKLQQAYKLTRSELIEKVSARLDEAEKARLMIESANNSKIGSALSIISATEESLMPIDAFPGPVFVSYAWEPNSEKIVEELENIFKDRGIRITRDKKDMEYKGSIEEFEQRIGKGACIILLISDKYLRSKHCMYELLLVHQNRDIRRRIFPIILEDAHIFEAEDRVEYLLHWQKKIKELNASIKKVDVISHINGLTTELNKFTEIRAKIDEFASMLSDMNCLTPTALESQGYSILIESVLKTITENNRKTSK